jgi:hypothetical protein
MNDVKRWKGHELYHSKADWIPASSFDALAAELAEARSVMVNDSVDAARYRWLRRRVEIRWLEAVPGSDRALCVIVGFAFLDGGWPVMDSDVRRWQLLSAPNDARGVTLDTAIDVALKDSSE